MGAPEAEDRGYRAFQEAVAREQQSLFTHFGHREFDAIPKTRVDLIRTKISWYMFLKPYDNLPDEDVSAVDKIRRRLLTFSGDGENLLLGCIYVHIRLKENESVYCIPLFKLKKCEEDECTIFYEPYSDRFYKNGWKQWKRETRLPACWMGYNKKGRFISRDDDHTRVHVRFRLSPSWNSKIKITDIVITLTGVVATGVISGSALFPPLLPLIGVAGKVLTGCVLYGASRSVYELVDRYKHEQNCKPTDLVTLAHWLNIFAAMSALKGTGMVLRKRLPRLPRLPRLCGMTMMNVLSLSVNCSGFSLTVVSLLKRYSAGELDWSDLRTFASLVFFLTNIVITVPVGRQILESLSTDPDRMIDMFNMNAGIIFSAVRNVEYTSHLKILRKCWYGLKREALSRFILPIAEFFQAVTRLCLETLRFDEATLIKLIFFEIFLEHLINVSRREMNYLDELLVNNPPRETPTADSLGALKSNVAAQYLTARPSGILAMEIMDHVRHFIASVGFASPNIIEEATGSTIRLIS